MKKGKKGKHHANRKVADFMVEPSGAQKENSPPPLSEIWISAHKCDKISDLLLYSLKKGNTKSTRNIIPLFQFHTLYKAEFKALSTSIIKAIYTKTKYLQKHTTCDFSMILCALHFETLQFTNRSKHCKRRAFSAITYSNRLSVMWIRFILV